ncbi:MAG: hypothetical protein ACLP1Q_17575 [Solirubrobacteraceae bacterium]|jgi:hypothetical protein
MTNEANDHHTSPGPRLASEGEPSAPAAGTASNGRRVAEAISGDPLREYTAEAFFSIDAANTSAARKVLEAAVDAIDALLAGRAHRDCGDGRSRIQLCMECERDRYAVEEA